MSAPLTVAELLELIRRSGVIDELLVSDFVHRHETSDDSDARLCVEDMVRDGILTSFQAEQFLQGKWRGFTIGKYKLLERIGIGGMGQVFLCEHQVLKRRAALKVLPPAKAEQPAALGRFYREARAAAALQHANIVRTHDIDQDGDLHYIVMDYVAGPNLLELVKKFGALDLARATSYVQQIALALDFAFRNKIIHRDVKPGNVMIDRKGVAFLLDLGLARFLNDHSDQLTLKYDDKIVLGTADYVAPEQVLNSHAVDTRADIYGLGATFYYLLAGRPPFPTGSVSQKLLWHRTKEPAPIREVRPEVPEGLAAIVAKMMAKEPKDRYQTPAQLITELANWLPEFVPAPRSEEMPRLSPAATEDLDEAAELIGRGESPPPGAETARVSLSTSPTGSFSKLQPGSGPVAALESDSEPNACAIGSVSDFLLASPHPLSSSDTDRSAALDQTPRPPRRSTTTTTIEQLEYAPDSRRFPLGFVVAIVVVLMVIGLLVAVKN